MKRGYGRSPKEPVVCRDNVVYEVSQKVKEVRCGDPGVIGQLVAQIGLRETIDNNVHVPMRHLPYHESEHVITGAYDILHGGIRLEDIDAMRQHATTVEALGVSRLPNPSSVENFTLCFTAGDILQSDGGV